MEHERTRKNRLRGSGIARRLALTALCVLVISITASATCLAAVSWVKDGAKVSGAVGDQDGPGIMPDGSGGAILAWTDEREGAMTYDIYAQKVDQAGKQIWETPGLPGDFNGVPVCTIAGDQILLGVVTDGNSGAIVAWTDKRAGNYDIYAQRIDPNGVCLWSENGVPVSTAVGNQSGGSIVSDNQGGAIILWQDYRVDGFYADLYAQRIDPSGNRMWAGVAPSDQVSGQGSHTGSDQPLVPFINGVPICTAQGGQDYPDMISDGAGGAIVTWMDRRLGYDLADIYAQRVDSKGSLEWTPSDGVPVCTAENSEWLPTLTTDGSGGAIITWEDWRLGNNPPNIYAQKLDSSGSPRWNPNGVVVCDQWKGQHNPAITSDGNGGAIVTWADLRSEIRNDIYAQKLDSNGVAQWAAQAGGIAVRTGGFNHLSPQLVSDSEGGAFITWFELVSSSDYAVYTRQVIAGGQLGSPTAICTAASGGTRYPSMASDGGRGALVAWSDKRLGNYDIYAQKVINDHCGSGSGFAILALGLTLGLLSIGSYGGIRRRLRRPRSKQGY